MDYKEMYGSIKKDIEAGESFKILKLKYPLMTKPLFLKSGGSISRMRFSKENPTVRAIIGNPDYEPEDLEKPDNDYLVGSLLGDGHIEAIVDNAYTRTSLYRTGHCFAQAGYVKVIYEILKPFSSAVTLKSPTGRLQDWSLHFSTISSSKFNRYRDLFYTYGDNLVKLKDVAKLEIVSEMSWKALAFWIMDDGKRRGGRYCFSLCIGRSIQYTDKKIDNLVTWLSEKFGMKFYWSKDKLAYDIHILIESQELVKKNILPYIWPDFYYKFRCGPAECGEVYKNLDWYKEWERAKSGLEHPFFIKYSISDYTGSIDGLFKERCERYLFNLFLLKGYDAIKECGISYEDYLNRKKLKKFVKYYLNEEP